MSIDPVSKIPVSQELVTNGKEHSIQGGFLKTLSEDVWAVIIGGFLITAVLLIAFFSDNFSFSNPVYQWSNVDELFAKVLTLKNLLLITLLWAILLYLYSIANWLSGNDARKAATGFSIIYILAIFSLVIAGNKTINGIGIEYVVFALLIGLFLGNFFSLPAWIRDAARSEFFIKTGLVILGTSVLFTDMVKAGVPGMLQALLVVAVVWYFAFWLCKKLKVDDEFAVIIASAVSICGVSAAIVASGAINADKKKLSYVTTLVLLVAIPMLIIQPWMVKYFNIPEIVGGAWLGGTLDTTASVTAASQLVGPTALKTGVIIKFSQNVLIGFAAFLIATWWIFKKQDSKLNNGTKPSLKLIWERFPKFVLGFIAASLVFSFLIPDETSKQVSGFLNSLRTLWFALAFVSIGIEARFTELAKIENGRPAIAFTTAQLFNIFWTLILAYLLFGGILFPVPAIIGE